MEINPFIDALINAKVVSNNNKQSIIFGRKKISKSNNRIMTYKFIQTNNIRQPRHIWTVTKKEQTMKNKEHL